MKHEYFKQDFDVYSRESTRAFNELSYWSALFGHMIIDNMPLASEQNVLDVACATGFPLFEMAERLGPSSRLTGIDIWENALDVARETIKARAIPNVEVKFADAACLPFEDNSFNLATCNLGINNFEDPEYVLREIRRVLKKDGRFLLTSNLVGHMQEFFTMFLDVLEDEGLDHIIPLFQEHLEHRGSKESLICLLEEAGFEIKRILEDTFYYRYLDGSSFLNSYFIKACFMPAWKEIVPEANHKSAFRKVEFGLNYIASHAGELKMTIPAIYIEAI